MTDTLSNTLSYPFQIRVQGFPFLLQGWNNVYYKRDKLVNGKPIYRLDSYTLYYTIPILGMDVFWNGKNWVMQRECDPFPSITSQTEDLFGPWNHSSALKVTPA